MEAEDLESGCLCHSFYKIKMMLIERGQSVYTDSTYRQLNTLYKKYSSRGLSILAFPCNQFGQQEPGSDGEIYDFITKEKKSSFDLFRKVEVNSPNAHPLYKFLLGAGSSDCADNEGNCGAWASQGECENNPGFMHTACKLSCKLCDAPQGTAPPIKWNFESFLISRLDFRWLGSRQVD